MTIRPVKLGSMAPGLNNQLEPTQLATATPDGKAATYLYGAENVDLNDKGRLRRRRGTTLALAGVAHSLWADAKESFAVLNDVLVSLKQAGASIASTAIRAGMPRLPVSFSRGGDGEVYWTNGASIRRIHAGQDRPVVTQPLERIPAITAGSGGALPPGRYLVALTIAGQDGESPATPAVQVDVPEHGAITIGEVDHLAEVYLSGPNGEVLLHAGQAGVAGATIRTLTNDGRRCPTLNTTPMPPGSIVRHFSGCMLVASGNTVFISQPYNYGVLDPVKGFMSFPSPVTLIEPLDNGVYIGTADRTHWISDVLVAGTLQEVLPYGATPGTGLRSPAEEKVYWHSDRGLIVAGDNAAVKNAQEDVLDFGHAASGASLYREQNGIAQLITSRFGVEPSVAVATSFMDAEIVRKGTVL
jgi:hypothetical protein